MFHHHPQDESYLFRSILRVIFLPYASEVSEKKNGWEGSLDLQSYDFYGIFENYPILDKNDKSETFLKTSFFIQSVPTRFLFRVTGPF